MTTARARILLLADTHLGFDLPARPRVRRRRRGPDFFESFERALRPALAGEVDFVVHGGDLFFRSQVSPSLVDRAFGPLRQVADRGVPVLIVPGNHERSRIPFPLLTRYPNIAIFDRPRTFVYRAAGLRLAFSGFPYQREGIRGRLADLLAQAREGSEPADIRLLCMHHCVEGATVGPGDFTFRAGSDVLSAREIPAGLTAVLSGHIHRHQVLTTDLSSRPLTAPVLYPGSVERTSFAEQDETKGYLTIDLVSTADQPGQPRGCLTRWRFHPLPTRPMLSVTIRADGPPQSVAGELRSAIRRAPADAILRLRFTGTPAPGVRRLVSAASVRSLAPATMNVTVSLDFMATSERDSSTASSMTA